MRCAVDLRLIFYFVASFFSLRRAREERTMLRCETSGGERTERKQETEQGGWIIRGTILSFGHSPFTPSSSSSSSN